MQFVVYVHPIAISSPNYIEHVDELKEVAAADAYSVHCVVARGRPPCFPRAGCAFSTEETKGRMTKIAFADGLWGPNSSLSAC